MGRGKTNRIIESKTLGADDDSPPDVTARLRGRDQREPAATARDVEQEAAVSNQLERRPGEEKHRSEKHLAHDGDLDRHGRELAQHHAFPSLCAAADRRGHDCRAPGV
jgi:hypothetical protein